MNRSDFRTAIRDRAGLTTGDSLVTDTVLNRIIVRALDQVTREADWPWLQIASTLAFSAGDASKASPTGLLRVAALQHTDTGDPLTRHPLRILYRTPTSVRGRASSYAIFAGSIHVRAVPDVAETFGILYVRSEPAVADDSTAYLVPDGDSQGPVEWAAAKVLSMKREFDRAQEAKADYKAWVKRTLDNINMGKEPLRVEPRPGGAF